MALLNCAAQVNATLSRAGSQIPGEKGDSAHGNGLHSCRITGTPIQSDRNGCTFGLVRQCLLSYPLSEYRSNRAALAALAHYLSTAWNSPSAGMRTKPAAHAAAGLAANASPMALPDQYIVEVRRGPQVNPLSH